MSDTTKATHGNVTRAADTLAEVARTPAFPPAPADQTEPALPALEEKNVAVVESFIRYKLARGAETAWDLGYGLRLLKRLKPRNFQKWVQDTLPFSVRTAERYIRIAKEFRRDEVAGKGLSEVYRYLEPADVKEKPTTPPAPTTAVTTPEPVNLVGPTDPTPTGPAEPDKTVSPTQDDDDTPAEPTRAEVLAGAIVTVTEAVTDKWPELAELADRVKTLTDILIRERLAL